MCKMTLQQSYSFNKYLSTSYYRDLKSRRKSKPVSRKLTENYILAIGAMRGETSVTKAQRSNS